MTKNGLPPRFRTAGLGTAGLGTAGFRTALIAGGVALALSGAGAAAVTAATDPATPESSASAGANVEARGEAGAGKEGHGRHGGFGLRNALHGEFVVERDGTTVTMVTQRGTIEAVSDSSITVESTDGFSQSYTLNADTEIRKFAAAAEDGTFQRAADATAADLAVGDEVHIAGTKDGSTVTAVHIRAGDLPEPGKKHSEKRGGWGGHGEKRGGWGGHGEKRGGHGHGNRP